MAWYLARRGGAALLTLLLASVCVFLAVRALPGGPAVALSAESPDPNVIKAIEARYGFDQPLPVQYGRWIALAAQGNFGDSPTTGLPVASILANRVPVTLELAVLALVVAAVIGIPAGVLAARRPGSGIDYVASGLALGGLSIPHFWFGILLILGLSVSLHVLPSAGFVPILADPGGNLLHMLMPAVVLGTGLAAVVMRQTRSAMITALGSDYVRTARAKGMSEWSVVARHALRNSLVTVVTVLGLQLGLLIAGVVTVEQVFNIPGLGKLTLDSVFQRDYSTLQAVVLLTTTGYVISNLLVDLAYSVLNPRIRVAGAAS
ncbi:ABC transporter permease [Pseudonocardia acaciae]|uniref:ABC transporter permease n=1 Tax=Pseudonocardia acaciae TaxID=551276 RepID=UPI00048B7DCD|nr:ABC transporter permease [Pseudonocardia acaciae]